MIPSAFVTLDRLPLLPNGKVDRHALPAPVYDRSRFEIDYIAPRTDMEQSLAEIWAAILGQKKVGIHDNFFEIGGDSILAIQIISRANQAGIRLTVRQIFQHQSISELASFASSCSHTAAAQSPVTGPVPLTPIQHWFFEQPCLTLTTGIRPLCLSPSQT